jgi:lipopolysaccharide transport protein LptA
MRRCGIALIVLSLIAVMPGNACAESGRGNSRASVSQPAGQDIDILGDRVVVRSMPRGYVTTFTGNVKVQQGDMILTCDRLVVVYEKEKSRKGGVQIPSSKLGNPSNIETITASGHVHIVQGDKKAVAGKAVYDSAKRTVTLSEDPRVSQGPKILQAQKIIVQLTTVYQGTKNLEPGNTTKPGRSSKAKNESSIKSITALRRVRIVQGDTRLTAGKAVYDSASGIVTLTDKPQLLQGANVLQAKRIVIHIDENRIEFDGSGNQIKGRLNPGKRQE